MQGLEVRHLSMSFGGIHAVRDVSFEVPPGSIYSIIGPNGAGKTTIFNLLTRVATPSSGEVLFDGTNLLGLRQNQIARRGIARTFQNLELFQDATVVENVLAGQHINFSTSIWQEALGVAETRRQEDANRAEADRIVDYLGLRRFRDTPIAYLPYGICKIVELGRALAVKPRLLLLDEPAAGLNATETQRMGHWIRDINTSLNVTVVLIEHDMRLVEEVSHRVLAMESGRVLTVGEPQEVQRHPEVIAAYLGGVIA